MTTLAQELHDIAKQAKAIKTEDVENTKKAVKFFTKDLALVAQRGKFSKRTTCLVKKDGLSNSKYYCQTENDGGGFEITNINHVIRDIKAMGFKVDFLLQAGYCPLTISW